MNIFALASQVFTMHLRACIRGLFRPERWRMPMQRVLKLAVTLLPYTTMPSATPFWP
jgi:hypothetical protein